MNRFYIAYDAKPGTTVLQAFRHSDQLPADSTLSKWRSRGLIRRRGALDVLTTEGWKHFPQLSYTDQVPVRR